MGARLGHDGLHVGGRRVLGLMRQHSLLAPRRVGPPNGNLAHDGRIITDRPNVMWGTDATRFSTRQDGWCGRLPAACRFAVIGARYISRRRGSRKCTSAG